MKLDWVGQFNCVCKQVEQADSRDEPRGCIPGALYQATVSTGYRIMTGSDSEHPSRMEAAGEGYTKLDLSCQAVQSLPCQE